MTARIAELDTMYFFDGSLMALGPDTRVSSLTGPHRGLLEVDQAETTPEGELQMMPDRPLSLHGHSSRDEPVSARVSGTVTLSVRLGSLRVDLRQPAPVDAIQTETGTWLHPVDPQRGPAQLIGGLVERVRSLPDLADTLADLGIRDLPRYVARNAQLTFTPNRADAIPLCFGAGTQILTRFGRKRVEQLTTADDVITRDHGFQPVRWVGRVEVEARGDLAPVEFLPGAIGNDDTLLLAPDHRLLMRGRGPEALMGRREVFVSARDLVNDRNIRLSPGGRITYVRFLLDSHEIVYANGAQCESINPGDIALEDLDTRTRAELRALFPAASDSGARPELRSARMDATAEVRAAIGRLFVETPETGGPAPDDAPRPATKTRRRGGRAAGSRPRASRAKSRS